MASLRFNTFFGRKNIAKTLLISGLVCLFIWLGVWQLNRRQWRIAQNEALAAQLAQPPILLNENSDPDALLAMTDRKISAKGHFDYAGQVVLRNRNSDLNGPGVHLVAPYRLNNSEQVVLVDRGWLSSAEWADGDFDQYDETFASIEGIVEQYEQPARNSAENSAAQSELFRLTYDQMQSQIDGQLVPIVIRQTDPNSDPNARPLREPFNVDLSEGSHLSYAVQWFSFAIIFGAGYLFYLRREARQATADK